MRRVGIHPRMPQEGDSEVGRGDGELKRVQAVPEPSRMTLRNTRDQIGRAHQPNGDSKSADGDRHLPFHAQSGERRIHGGSLLSRACDDHMSRAREPFGGHRAP